MGRFWNQFGATVGTTKDSMIAGLDGWGQPLTT